jgi:hypothetical protein
VCVGSFLSQTTVQTLQGIRDASLQLVDSVHELLAGGLLGSGHFATAACAFARRKMTRSSSDRNSSVVISDIGRLETARVDLLGAVMTPPPDA